ncbi:NB-ARC domain-containing protein [Mycena venus]|uniref:NB-ARC domain-containing protein n=1 Tax=Mycena venus TaxID=2733690 RepID=A0A8H6YM85_9AGAR|nr:NB-ARC domain-containing protein [Mycena venus]
MPSNPIDNVLGYIKVAVNILVEIHATEVPLISTVARISLLVVETMEGLRLNKERWTRILDGVHELLCVLVAICSTDPDSALPPNVLHAIGQFAQNLQKIQSCIRSQQELSNFKRFFKQGEILAQLNSCEAETQELVHLFRLVSGSQLHAAIQEMELGADQRQQQLLALMETLSISDIGSSMRSIHLDQNSTSSILSLLPPPPQIFRGRETELQEVSAALLDESPRIAILGPGGIGKTVLATAALHHPDIVAKYTHRHFIQCEAANSANDLILAVGGHLNLEPSRTLSKNISDRLISSGSTVMIFDNFETPWEPSNSRGDVERFLSMLADIPHVALLPKITMRGAERPENIRWSRPFLPQLKPLPALAARDTFIDIADKPSGSDEELALDGLLDATGNVPLAISLMANVASYEGYGPALARWEAEHTELISEGFDRRSNLEKSILISLNSPRIAATPHALHLLRLLAMLPDGTSDVELRQSDVPIPDILHTKSLLLRTSLAYLDHDGRLKVLVPIREYMNTISPPPKLVIMAMRNYLYELLRGWDQRRQLSSNSFIPHLTANLANIQALAKDGLNGQDEDLTQAVLMVLALDRFTTVTARGGTSLMQRLPAVLVRVSDEALHGKYLRAMFSSYPAQIPPHDVERLTQKGHWAFPKCP